MARTDEERFKVQFARLRREKEKTQARISAEQYQKLVRQFKDKALARKAIHLAAPKGFVKTITRPKGEGKGRGRPSGTFKTRVLPSGRVVKVPTAVYNKMRSAEIRARRLATAQRQANIQQQQYEAEQIAIQQDPRFEQSRDSFLESADMQHEQNVEAEQQKQFAMENLQSMQQQQPQGGFVQRAGNIMRRLGAGVNRLGGLGQVRGQPQQFQGQPRQIPRTMEEARQIKASQNILNVPFIFGASQQIDTPGTKISLMDTDRRNQQIIAREEYMKDLQRRTDPNYGKSSILNTNVQENILNARSPTGRVIGF